MYGRGPQIKSPVRPIFFQVKINFHVRLFKLQLSKVLALEAEMCFREKLYFNLYIEHLSK